MKYTLCITLACNLACRYCYVGKRRERMSPATARRIVDFLFARSPVDEAMDIGFFGGEPLLEFPLLREITTIVEAHPRYTPERVRLTVVSNGTLLDDDMLAFIRERGMNLNISCDGPPAVHDRFRIFADGRGSGERVEAAVRRAMEVLGPFPVNAVFHPQTLERLPEVVGYLAGLGVRHIYLNPDFSAPWTAADAARLPAVFARLAELYVDFYRRGDPRFISVVDGKMAVILRGGYQPAERCSMGRGELSFTPDGAIYPCERLLGNGDAERHRIGHIDDGVDATRMCRHRAGGAALNTECLECGVREYCMNWCGCSNYFSSGFYDRVGPFLCAFERTCLQTAFRVIHQLEESVGPSAFHHLAGIHARNALYTVEPRPEAAGEHAGACRAAE